MGWTCVVQLGVLVEFVRSLLISRVGLPAELHGVVCWAAHACFATLLARRRGSGAGLAHLHRSHSRSGEGTTVKKPIRFGMRCPRLLRSQLAVRSQLAHCLFPHPTTPLASSRFMVATLATPYNHPTRQCNGAFPTKNRMVPNHHRVRRPRPPADAPYPLTPSGVATTPPPIFPNAHR